MQFDATIDGKKPVSRDDALDAMHQLLLREQIYVERAELDRLFRKRWSQLSTLAHQIHDHI